MSNTQKVPATSAHSSRFLLVSTTALGDTLLSTPAIRAVRESFPKAFIATLCHVNYQDLLKYNPHIDQLYLYRGKAKGNLRLIRALRKARFDAAVILHGNDPEAVALCYFSRIPFIVGNARSQLALAINQPITKPGKEMHLIDHRLASIAAIGAKPSAKNSHDMELFCSEREDSHISNWISKKGIERKKMIAIHTGGSLKTKQWKNLRWAIVADELHRNFQAEILFIGGSKEREMIREILLLSRFRHFCAAGEFSLLETAALIKRSALCISTDSGPMHMALAVKTPLLTLFGPDHAGSSGPHPLCPIPHLTLEANPPCKASCDRRSCPDNICMSEISVIEVLYSTTQIIAHLSASFGLRLRQRIRKKLDVS